MTIAVLLMPEVSEFNGEIMAGTERAMIYDLKILRKHKIDFSVYSCAKMEKKYAEKYHFKYIYYPGFLNTLLLSKFPAVIDSKIKRLTTFFQLLFLNFYVLQFGILARRETLWCSYSAPLLSIIAPRKTINMYFSNFPMPFYSILKNRYKKARYLFVSKFLREEVTSKFKATCINSSIMKACVDTSIFSLKNTKTKTAYPTFAFTGAWLKIKGVFTYLELLKKLHDNNNKFSALLIGSADLWRVGYSRDYVSNIDVGITNFAKNIPELKIIGAVNFKQLSIIYDSVDYLVCPSNWGEPAPLSCLEAMACGIGILGYKDGGIPEEVVEGKTGYLVQTGNSHNLYRLMVKVCNGKLPRLNPRIVRRHIIKHYSLSIREEQLLNYLKKTEKVNLNKWIV